MALRIREHTEADPGHLLCGLIADGEFVFTQGEGVLHKQPTVFYDIFRVEQGRLAEPWDVVYPKPEQLPHDNGLF